MSDSRSRFEAWAKIHIKDDRDYDRFFSGVYASPLMQLRYEAWQAGRADGQAEAVKACVDHINGHSTVDDKSDRMIAGIRAEFSEAFK